MPSVPSEPEKYSIDEMMDRLKGGSDGKPEDGELVTRADGSQAIRVRKRKRRSTQPHKEEQKRSRRARIAQVSAALVLAFVALLAIGGAVIYANSKPFRDSLVAKIGAATGAGVELVQFRMNPRAANAGGVELRWPAGNVLESLKLRGLQAVVAPSSFTGRAMKGEEVMIAAADLKLQIPQPDEPLRLIAAAAGESPLLFNRYRTPQLNITLGEDSAPLLRVGQAEASLSTTSAAGRPQMRLYQGQLAIAGWPALPIDRGLFEFRGGEVEVVSLRLQDGGDSQGWMEFSGTLAPMQPERINALDVRLNHFDLAAIAGPDLGSIFIGKVDSAGPEGANVFTFRPTSEPNARLEIAFLSSPTSTMDMQALPLLGVLAQTLEDKWFEHPVFENDASGTIRRSEGMISLSDLKMVAKARMALRGEISATASGELSGTLKVGLTDAMITTSASPKLNAAFGPVVDGFRWLETEIRGTSSAPADDFREKIAAAVPEGTPVTEPGESRKSTFEELTHPR